MPQRSTWSLSLLVFVAISLHAPSALADAQGERDIPRAPSVYTKDGLLGPVRAGPTVGVGAPDGLRFGLFGTWKGLMGAGGAFSVVPSLGVPGSTAQVHRTSAEGFVRLHPFRNALFVGIAGGFARTEGTSSTQVKASRTTPASNADFHAVGSAVYVAPHAGVRWMLPFGMTVGCDLGIELPIASTGPTFDASFSGDTRRVEGKGALASAMTFATKKPVPVLHLLEVGCAF